MKFQQSPVNRYEFSDQTKQGESTAAMHEIRIAAVKSTDDVAWLTIIVADAGNPYVSAAIEQVPQQEPARLSSH